MNLVPAYIGLRVVFCFQFLFIGYQEPGIEGPFFVKMVLKFLPFVAIIIPVLGSTSSQKEDLTKYVNPFIGTEGQGNPGTAVNGGNVFPGPALPFGVVKFGIDTTAFDWTNVDANAGYTPDGYGRSSGEVKIPS